MQPFGARRALQPGASTFAGHGRLSKVLSLLGSETTHSVSVTGPKLSGRSSLLAQLSSTAVLAAYPALADAIVVQADFREYRGYGASAMRYLIDTVASELERRELDATRVREATTMVECVRRALELVHGRRLFIAIDDFERVGSDLRKDEQADLRTAVNKQPLAGYVVASRLPLSRCLEEFGDDLSDFAPSCTPLPRLLAPLSLRDVREMTDRAMRGASPEEHAMLAHHVHSRVGGFAFWVQQGLAAATDVLDAHGDDLERALDREIRGRIEDDLFLSFRRVSATAQDVIAEGVIGGELPAAELDEMVLAGWAHPARPTFVPSGTLIEQWIRDRAWDRPGYRTAPKDADQYERLVRAVEHLNVRYQRALAKRGELIIRPDVFHISSDVAFLRRSTNSVDDLGRKVLALARLLYEGSGGGTKGKLRLPQWCYDSPESIVYQVARLRHDFVHLANSDEQQADRDTRTGSEIYERYIGDPGPPSCEQARRMGDALIEEAIFQLEVLQRYCPFPAGLKVGDLLADARRSRTQDVR